MAIDHLMDATGQSREDFSCSDLLHRSHQRFSPPTRVFAALYPLATQAILRAAFVCSTIDSSTSRSWSLPKNISLPTKNVGEPKLPRATASAVLSISFFLTSSCWARE